MHIVDIDNESTSYITDNFYDLTEDSYRLPLISSNNQYFNKKRRSMPIEQQQTPDFGIGEVELTHDSFDN